MDILKRHMGHYIDADKLLAEIEQKISICEKQRSDAIEVECYNLADHASARIGELHVIQETIAALQQEQPEVDLDALVDETFDKYSSVDGYGQLSVSFNRTELYSFIKKIARKEE